MPGSYALAPGGSTGVRLKLTHYPGTWVWVGVEDVATLYEEYRASGAKIRLPPGNYPWAYEMHVEDPDGHVLRFGSKRRADLQIAEATF
ncbi:MAG: VOC family protein [Candidatus Polarisedimenticolia bacterium]